MGDRGDLGGRGELGPSRNDTTAGLFYASIPDTTPELLQPARDALSQLKVDG